MMIPPSPQTYYPSPYLSLNLHACTRYRCQNHCQTPLSMHPILCFIMLAATRGCTGYAGSTLRVLMGGCNMQERMDCIVQINLSTHS